MKMKIQEVKILTTHGDIEEIGKITDQSEIVSLFTSGMIAAENDFEYNMTQYRITEVFLTRNEAGEIILNLSVEDFM
jgi:hypothetical protein